MKPLSVIFIGPQGSGKGTQIEALKSWLHEREPGRSVVHVQTGKPFRELAETGGYTSSVVKELIESGNLVPNVITNALVAQEFVAEMKEDSHVLIDGYPRDLAQAKTLDDLLGFYGREDIVIVFLDTPEAVVIERLLSRGRSDDSHESIAERLRLYREVTAPVLEYYRARANTHTITVKGDQPEAAVTAEMVDQLGKLNT